MNKTTLNIHIKHFISKKLKKLLWYFKFKCIFYMIYLCRAAEENANYWEYFHFNEALWGLFEDYYYDILRIFVSQAEC